MGFARSIKSNTVAEWKDFYVNYTKLRARIKHRDFKNAMHQEMQKINSFYYLLEKKAIDEKNQIFDDCYSENPKESFADLRAQTELTDDEVGSKRINKHMLHKMVKARISDVSETENEDTKADDSSNITSLIRMPRGLTLRKKEKNLTEFLHSLVKIIAYRDLNASALLRLAKLYSEKRRQDTFYEEFSEKLKASYFYKSKKAELIRMAIKQLYQRLFAKNEPEKARTVFRRIRRGNTTSDWSYIVSGLLAGVSLVCAYHIEHPYDAKSFFFWPVLLIYFGFFLFGICLKIFKSTQINYKFIFNFDVCSSMNNSLYMISASIFIFSHVVLSSIIRHLCGSYEISDSKTTDIKNKEYITEKQNHYEMVSFLVQCTIFGLPMDVFFYNSRLYLFGAYAHAFFKHLSEVRFRHFYFIDVLQSFSFVFKRLFKTFGERSHYYSYSFIAIFPAIRIVQCLRRYRTSKLAFPHIANAVKYILAIFLIILRLFKKEMESGDKLGQRIRLLEQVLSVVNSSFGVIWDYMMDWVLTRNKFVFPKNFYIFACVYDIFARFSWVFGRHYQNSEELGAFEAMVEVVRRFIWTVIRVEVEHLNNCDKLRAKNDIALTSGELFYKKDQEETEAAQAETGNETATETATETENSETDEGREKESVSNETEHEDDEM
ncbi:xenotropic and polytropic retrovirus receptor 1 [Enteropsectra breve]|nr:xenotropic and polytropic retrovirus receptor 1 [Enteropsectra breve]